MNNYFPGFEMTLAEYLATRHTLKDTDLVRITDSTENPLAIGQELLTAGDPSGQGASFLTATDETATYPTSVDIGALGANASKNMLQYTIANGEATFSQINIPAATNGFLRNASGVAAFGTTLTLTTPQEYTVAVDNFRVRYNATGLNLENTAVANVGIGMTATEVRVKSPAALVYSVYDSTGVTTNVASGQYMELLPGRMRQFYSGTALVSLTPTTYEIRMADCQIYLDGTNTKITSIDGLRYINVSTTSLLFNVAASQYMELLPARMRQYYSATAFNSITPTTNEFRMADCRIYQDGTTTKISSIADVQKYIQVSSTAVTMNGSSGQSIAMDGTTGTTIALNSLDFTWSGLDSGTGTNLVISGGGVVTSLTSSLRFKKDVTDLEVDSSKIYDLETKSFSYKNSADRTFGLIAEEVNEVLPEVVVFDPEGLPHGINYTTLPLLMLEEIKKLKARIEVLESK